MMVIKGSPIMDIEWFNSSFKHKVKSQISPDIGNHTWQLFPCFWPKRIMPFLVRPFPIANSHSLIIFLLPTCCQSTSHLGSCLLPIPPPWPSWLTMAFGEAPILYLLNASPLNSSSAHLLASYLLPPLVLIKLSLNLPFYPLFSPPFPPLTPPHTYQHVLTNVHSLVIK